MKQVYEIVAAVDFNYDKDTEKFGGGDRIVRVNCFRDEDKQTTIGITFNLGAKADDTVGLCLPLDEFMVKLGKAIFEAEH